MRSVASGAVAALAVLGACTTNGSGGETGCAPGEPPPWYFDITGGADPALVGGTAAFTETDGRYYLTIDYSRDGTAYEVIYEVTAE